MADVACMMAVPRQILADVAFLLETRNPVSTDASCILVMPMQILNDDAAYLPLEPIQILADVSCPLEKPSEILTCTFPEYGEYHRRRSRTSCRCPHQSYSSSSNLFFHANHIHGSPRQPHGSFLASCDAFRVLFGDEVHRGQLHRHSSHQQFP